MTEQPQSKKRHPVKLIVIVAGSLLALCMVCGLISTLSDRSKTPTSGTDMRVATVSGLDAAATSRPSATPEPSATAEPTVAPTEALEPTATPDCTAEAKQLQADVLALFAPAEQAGKRFAEYAQAIADGKSYDMAELYTRGKAAAEAWESVKFDIHGLKPQSPDLREALSDLSLCASYREDAYRAALKWIDSQKASDMAAYKEHMARADELLLSGFAKIVSIVGIEPTAQP